MKGRFKDEAQLQGKLTRLFSGRAGCDWRKVLGEGSFAYEVKLVRMWRKGVGGLRFSELPDHELKSLLLASGSRGKSAWGCYVGGGGGGSVRAAWALHHKISDSALGFKPCDGFVLDEARGFLVVGYDWGGVAGCAVVAVDAVRYIDFWVASGGRGSLSYDDAVGACGGVLLEGV